MRLGPQTHLGSGWCRHTLSGLRSSPTCPSRWWAGQLSKGLVQPWNFMWHDLLGTLQERHRLGPEDP